MWSPDWSEIGGGAFTGAASGAAIGGMIGSVPGAAIGAGVGALAGAVGGATHTAPGGSNDYLLGGAKRYKSAQEQAEAEASARAAAQKQLQDEQARYRALTNQTNAQFGQGTDAVALSNSRLIGEKRNQIIQNAQSQAQQQADVEFGAGASADRIRAARSGTAGSGMDAQNLANTRSQYANQLAAAQQTGQQAGQAFDTSLNQSRNQALDVVNNRMQGNQINTGAMRADYGTLNAASNFGTNFMNQIGANLPSSTAAYGEYQKSKTKAATAPIY